MLLYALSRGVDFMGQITATEAKEMLNLWLEAERAVATGKSYRIGSRQLQRCDMSEIREAQKYWRNQLAQAESGRGSGMRVMQGVPRDW